VLEPPIPFRLGEAMEAGHLYNHGHAIAKCQPNFCWAMLDRMPPSSTTGPTRLSFADWTTMNHAIGRQKDHLARIMFGISPTNPLEGWLLRLVAFFIFGYNRPSLIDTAIGVNCWRARCSPDR